MEKDFDRWNERKKDLDKNKTEPHFYHTREVRWCSLGINVGFEQNGTSKLYRRPVLIIKGFSRYTCLVVPVTTSIKENPYRISIGKFENKENFVILSQIRLIDTKRPHDRLTVIDKVKFNEIRKAIRKLF